ncbi:MAG: hypothetical protein AB7O57_14935 [Hyphomicrobiaceae bacterium]
MKASILVTGGDSAYFPLMREMIGSVRSHPAAAGIALGVLDCGLAAAEVDWCRGQGAAVVEPSWDVALRPDLPVPPSFRALTARPYLRRYFPGFDTYLWLDADVWVQDWRAAELLMTAAHLGDIAIVPEMHRSYRNFRDTRDDFEQANGRGYADAFGSETAHRLIRMPLNNAGVFAIASGSRTWDVWAAVLDEAARRSVNMIDQIALNVAIYDRGLREARLPATCNWIAHLATPAWDPGRNLLVEPDPPYEPIGILHMTLATKWAPSLELPLANGTGGTIARSLRWPGRTAIL